MMDDFTDDELRALRAADPAAGDAAPQALRDRITTIPDAEPRSAPVPLKPRRRWLLPAAAAAAVVAAIGGGYVWGTGGLDLTPTVVPMAVETGTPDDPAPPIGGFSGADGDPSGAGPDAGSVGSVPGSRFETTQSADAAYYSVGPRWGSFTQQRFILPELDDTPGTASVYALDGRAQYSAEDAERMAAVLGVTGEARNNGNTGWAVRDSSGSRFELTLWGGAGASYSSGIIDPWTACYNDISPGYDLENGVGEAMNAEIQQCLEETPLPTEQQAREALAGFLAATGVDVDATRITVTPETVSRTMTVTAARVVDSNETEIITHVAVSAEGTLSAFGATGRIVSLGDYSIVSPAEGAARLNDPAYSPRLVSWPEQDGVAPEYVPPTSPPEVPAAGSPVPWAIAEREIVSARLGLALLVGVGDEQFLAPAYEFTADDDTVWSVVALAEDVLDTTSTEPPFFAPWW